MNMRKWVRRCAIDAKATTIPHTVRGPSGCLYGIARPGTPVYFEPLDFGPIARVRRILARSMSVGRYTARDVIGHVRSARRAYEAAGAITPTTL